MKKRANRKELIFVLSIFLIGLLVIIGFKITGFVTEENLGEVSVIRLVEKNQQDNLTEVKLNIASTENVLAIQEKFSSVDCVVLDYSIEPGIDIFEFNENENTWILADRSDNLIIDMFYNIPYECDVSEGFYFILTQSVNWCNGADTNKDGSVDSTDLAILGQNWCPTCTDKIAGQGDTDSDGDVDSTDLATLGLNWKRTDCSELSDELFKGGVASEQDLREFEEQAAENLGITTEEVQAAVSSGGGGGSGGSGISTTQLQSEQIIEAQSQEQFTELREKAVQVVKKISGQESPGEVRKIPVTLVLILILIVIGIIVFLFISFVKKPGQTAK